MFPYYNECKIVLYYIIIFVSGWLFKIEIADEQELPKLMDEEQYQKFLKEAQQH